MNYRVDTIKSNIGKGEGHTISAGQQKGILA